jgi:hypothetical protein
MGSVSRRGVLAAGVLVVASGCGRGRPLADAGGGGFAEPGVDEAAARRALRRWAGFPVRAAPRPLVLTGQLVDDPRNGFPDGDSKLAYLAGAFDPPPVFPAGPRQAAGFPVIDARQAVGLLRQQGSKQQVSTRLRVTAMRLASAVFDTDRGPRRLPAWQCTLAGVDAPAHVLAVAPASRYTPPAPITTGPAGPNGATVGHDGRTLTLAFIGAAPGRDPCSAEYTAHTVESDRAVAIWVTQLPPDRPADPGTACTLVGYGRTATARLAGPLGARVLIDAASAAPLSAAT